MTVSYTQVTVTGYNSSPPSDDGATDSSNRITWAGIKTKLADPIKTALDTIDDNVAAAIALAETDINTLETADTTNLATLRAELNAPSGTVSPFAQTAAPTGWTKGSTHDNKALRLVTGTASSGGSTAFTSVFTARTVAQVNLPSYNLSLASLTGSVGTTITNGTGVTRDFAIGGGNARAAGGSGNYTEVGTFTWTSSTLALASGAVTFGGSIPLGGSGTAMDFAVQYVDVILATKN